MRAISFPNSLDAYLDGSKTVDRRVSWQFLRVGDVLRVVKRTGLKRGEHAETLGHVKVTQARRERLDRLVTLPGYGVDEMQKEGTTLTPPEFVEWFCSKHTGCFRGRVITRFEFRRLP